MKLQQFNKISIHQCIYCNHKPSFLSLENSSHNSYISFFFYCNKHFKEFKFSQKDNQAYSLLSSLNIQNLSNKDIQNFLDQTFKKFSLLE